MSECQEIPARSTAVVPVVSLFELNNESTVQTM